MSNMLDNKLKQEPQALSAAEQELLHAADAAIPAAPDRQRLLAAAYRAGETQPKETNMIPNPITRLFAGQPRTLRFAIGTALLLGLLTLSLVLPRGGTLSPVAPAWAADNGYLLAFDFGDADINSIQPVIDELVATVKAFKEQHGIADGENRYNQHNQTRVLRRIERHGDAPPVETSSETRRAVVMVTLPNGELLDEFKAELAKIPSLPEPQLTNATWFRMEGLPDPSEKGISLALSFEKDGQTSPHTFYFPETATEVEIQTSINEWLAANMPDHEFEVDVDLEVTENGESRSLSVKIKGNTDSGLDGLTAE